MALKLAMVLKPAMVDIAVIRWICSAALPILADG
jgi:hypothetical protein